MDEGKGRLCGGGAYLRALSEAQQNKIRRSLSSFSGKAASWSLLSLLTCALTPARPLLVWQITMLARLISSAACSSLGRGATAAVPRALVPCSTSFAAAWRAEQPAALTRTIKTHAGTKKRFSVTKSGKVKCYKNGKSHLAQSKNRKRMLRLGKTNFLEGPQAKMIKTILGK